MTTLSKLRIEYVAFACVVLGFPLASLAETGPSGQACEPGPKDSVTKFVECIRRDSVRDQMIVFNPIADSEASSGNDEQEFEASAAVATSNASYLG